MRDVCVSVERDSVHVPGGLVDSKFQEKVQDVAVPAVLAYAG